MWLRVRSAGFAGPFAPLVHNSLSFKLIPCFRSSSSLGRLQTARPAGLKSLSQLLLSLGESAWPELGDSWLNLYSEVPGLQTPGLVVLRPAKR